jgi:S-DNA-T family DNA segregation ATPase FtsK/SpoIIIE
MRVTVTIVDPRWDLHEDVVIDAEDSTPMRDVIAELLAVAASPSSDEVGGSAGELVSLDDLRAARGKGQPDRTVVPVGGGTVATAVSPAAGSPTLYHRGEPLDPDVPLAESGLREGSVVTIGDPLASVVDEPDGVVEVRVVSGEGAGIVHRLGVGEATIGSDPACVVPLADPLLPAVTALVTVRADGTVQVAPAGGAMEAVTAAYPHLDTPLALDRAPLDGSSPPPDPDAKEDKGKDKPARKEKPAKGSGAPTGPLTWPVGGQVTIGETLLELERVTPADAAVEDSPEPGWVDYNRPPRLLPPERKTAFKLPAPPSEQAKGGLPWLVMLAPLALSIVLALAMKRPSMLMMGLFSPVMMLGSYYQGKKQGKVTYRQQLTEYKERKARIEADAEQAVVDERLARRNDAPDPATALLIATGPRARLWERRRTDPDYLAVRIGIGDLESEVTVDDPEELEHRRQQSRIAYAVPVTVPIAERGVVGIAGRGTLPRRLGAWAVAQVGVMQSPRDTQVYVLTDAEGARDWDWLRWLPHARPAAGQDTITTIGTDAETSARRIAELTAMLAARKKAAADRTGGAKIGDPDVVVVFDGARRLRSLPGVVAILKEGPAVGIYSLCLDADERLLPEEASAVVVETHRGVSIRQQRITVVDDVNPDLVDLPWFNRAARALAPLRDISGGDSDSVLPSACRLTEVMQLEPPSADLIGARWAVSPRSTEAVVGISLDGPFAIDMRRDGPHGLIAGTTGAGKSELLQTIVASLAVANRPDGMTFVLVDYKGGAAFKDCVDLPHTVGMVTDLDTHLVERALTSLGAELTRREHILAEVGAKDIEDYVDIAAKRTGLPDMPRLLIVIDEFASLARELPDFVTGLVNIAQRGRSLGIHLILATQRPSGVVSPEIRANTNLRIALRVTDGTESSDVIDAPDAGLISKSTPGRAYVRLGAQSLVPFQSGRVGGRRPGTVAASTGTPWMTRIGTSALAQPAPTKPRQEASTDAEVTDLTVLVAAIREANDKLGLPQQHSPWLPALTTEVQLDELLESVTVPPGPQLASVPFAIEDIPAEQARRPAALEWDTFSHLSIVGGPRSGRSQALRTIAASIARLTSPADVHLYGLDCGNGALLPMTELPHTGAVVQRTQTDRATRLFARLMAELSRRQEVLASGGFADLDEQRASVPEDDRLPHIVLLIDRWEGFLGSLAELDGGSLNDDVQTLLREGASAGIHLVMTGDRQLVNARMASLVEDKIALRLPDRSDYGLIGLRATKLPEDVPEGRAFRAETAIELQFALLGEDASGQAQAAALRAIGAEATQRYADVPRAQRAFRVDVLPSRIGFDEAWGYREDAEARPLWALAGVGGDELTAYGFDLARTNVAVVAGPPRSGRSTALLAIVESLLRGGSEVVVAAPRPSPLRDLEGRDGVRAVLTGVELEDADLAGVMDEGDGPVVLVIDDGELLKDVEAKDYLKSLIRTGADRGRALVLGGDSAEVGSGFSGWQVDAKGRQGMLISPQGITDGELIGVRVPRSSLGAQQQAGRVMVNVGDGELRIVQVPLPD